MNAGIFLEICGLGRSSTFLYVKGRSEHEVRKMYEKGFAYLFEAEHEKLVYGVLKNVHVTRAVPLYEDLLQEARIAYAKAYEQYYKRPQKVRLNVYLYQNVKWRLLDLLRKEARTKGKETNVSAGFLQVAGGVSEPGEIARKFEQKEWLLEIYQNCRPLEKKYLELLVLKEKTPAEVAVELGVSRQAVYNFRKKLKSKYK